MPNPKLFKDGVNLIILQIANRDITNNIEIVCPTNHYSDGFFDIRKVLTKVRSLTDFSSA
jgi:hypothetical protein